MEFSNVTAVDLLGDGGLNATAVYSLGRKMNKTVNALVVVVVVVTMFALGCTMDITKIKAHIMKPKGVVIGVVAQFGIMPLAAFCLAKAFRLTGMQAVVVLICGCCPAGHVSNILSLAINGDMNLSLAMTTCSTVLALGMMPLFMLLYCQGFDNLQNAVPYLDIVLSLLLMLVPCGFGVLLHHYRPKYSKIIIKTCMILCAIVLSVTIGLIICEAGENVLVNLAPPLVAIAFLLPLIGFALGYVFSCVLRLSQPERRTVMMETGCQNGRLALTIIKLGFPPAEVGTLFLYPEVVLGTQVLEAVLLVLVYRAHQCWQQRKTKGGYLPGTREAQ